MADAGSVSWELEAGSNIREWVIGADGATNTISEDVTPVWRGQHNPGGKDAVIDHLALSVPETLHTGQVQYILIEDLSRQVFNHANPGIVVWGITVEYEE